MFARRGTLISVINRKVKIKSGVADLDYTVDGHKNGILLHTADTEHLTKGKKHVIILTTQVVPMDRAILVKVNNALHKDAVVSGTTIIDSQDDGTIILSITPRKDIDLGSLEYIVKLMVEGFN